MEIQRHMVWHGDGWSTENTIRIPNCQATVWGYAEFTWNGRKIRWVLPDAVISHLRSGGDFFAMDCTFDEGEGVLTPTALVVGSELVIPDSVG